MNTAHWVHFRKTWRLIIVYAAAWYAGLKEKGNSNWIETPLNRIKSIIQLWIKASASGQFAGYAHRIRTEEEKKESEEDDIRKNLRSSSAVTTATRGRAVKRAKISNGLRRSIVIEVDRCLEFHGAAVLELFPTGLWGVFGNGNVQDSAVCM